MYAKRLALVLCCALALVACNRNRTDVKQTVEKSLIQAGFEHNVNVKFDNDKRLVTLTGRVRSDDLKAKAGQVAQEAAPGNVVSNELSVEPVDEEHKARQIEGNVDEAIEKNYKAVLIANRLDDQRIRFHAKNGVLTLEGRVKNADIRTQAEKVAVSVPNVQQVVNKLDVGR